MERLFGLETEYGIQVDGVDDMDVVVESMELIRCYLQADFVAMWDYGRENPRLDMRGFEVDELRNDEDETLHLQRDRERQIPLKELKSDLIIHNGARLYNDHTHPEYSTPECYSLFDLVASDRAGERILLHCGRRRTAARGGGVVRLYKNNTDFEGHSYGCHENYLVSRVLPFEQVVDGLLPFVVTRQIIGGAGKVGVEQDSRADGAIFQLSQRADFFETIVSVDTMHRRPLVNSRDEPHADPERYRRLHLITGDANMSEYATALKVGTTSLVLDLLEAGKLPAWKLADPVAAFKAVSRDQTRQWTVPLEGRRQAAALEIQRDLCEQAGRFAAGRDAETDWVLGEWRTVLEQLEGDPESLVGRIDWATKKWLLDAFVEAEGLDWKNADHLAWLQSQDLEYHNIDPQEGLFLMLEESGQVERLTDEERIGLALVEPPADTRAFFRGKCLERFGEAVRALNWDSIELAWDGRTEVVDLKGCVEPAAVERINRAVASAHSVDELLAALREPREEGNR